MHTPSHHLGVAAYIHRAVVDVDNDTFEFGPLFDKEPRGTVGEGGFTYQPARLGQGLRGASGSETTEVFFELAAVLSENVVSGIYCHVGAVISNGGGKTAGVEVGTAPGKGQQLALVPHQGAATASRATASARAASGHTWPATKRASAGSAGYFTAR